MSRPTAIADHRPEGHARPGRLARCLAAGLAATLLGGCNVSKRRSFEGVRPTTLWTAMQAAAETPDYDSDDPRKKWFVKENHVHRDGEAAKLEVYRELDRIVRGPMTGLDLRERRAWRFTIRLENTEPPSATFTVRGLVVPTRASTEAQRYFDAVETVLAGLPGGDAPDPDGDAPASVPAAAIVPPNWLDPVPPAEDDRDADGESEDDAEAPDAPPIDVDDLDR